jgi:transposase-like protein
MDCSQVYKLLSNDQTNDKMRLVLSKRPKTMEKLYTDEQQSSNNEDNSRLTRINWDDNSNGSNLGAIGGCRTTAL